MFQTTGSVMECHYSRPVEEAQQYSAGTSELVVTTPTTLATRHTHHHPIEQVRVQKTIAKIQLVC